MDIRDQPMTRAEYLAYSDKESHRMLGVSYAEALELLASGELDGTLAETRLRMMASMLEDDPEPIAAE